MAPISKLISFLFLTTLSLSLQINARDSQFFSKITPIKDNNNVREVPNNEEQINKPEEQPVFTPETENSYGLYGHESGLNPPSTTYKPYKTTTEEEFNNNNNFNFQKDGYNTKYQNEFSDTRLAANSYTTNNNNYNKKQQNEFSDTKFTEGGYNSMENQNQNENNKYYYNNNAATGNEKYYFNNNNAPNDRYSFKNKAVSKGYKGERLGMSDTRFMEGGKYFYNVNSEKYNPTTVYEGQGSSNSENWYDNKGYFGNNNNNVNKNSMEGYQNQEEFEEDQQEFEP